MQEENKEDLLAQAAADLGLALRDPEAIAGVPEEIPSVEGDAVPTAEAVVSPAKPAESWKPSEPVKPPRRWPLRLLLAILLLLTLALSAWEFRDIAAAGAEMTEVAGPTDMPPPLPEMPEDIGQEHGQEHEPEHASSAAVTESHLGPIRDSTMLHNLQCPVRGGGTATFQLSLTTAALHGLEPMVAQPLLAQAPICEFFYIPGPRSKGLEGLEERILDRLRTVFPESGIASAGIHNLTLTVPQ